MGCGECTPGWETLRSRKVMLDKELSEGRSLQSSVGKYSDVKRLLWCEGYPEWWLVMLSCSFS